MTDFPVLDAPRPIADSEIGRLVIDDQLAPIEPFIEETDWYVTMPIRLVYDQGSALHLEIGPYSMCKTDIERLRAAITAYDKAQGANE